MQHGSLMHPALLNLCTMGVSDLPDGGMRYTLGESRGSESTFAETLRRSAGAAPY